MRTAYTAWGGVLAATFLFVAMVDCAGSQPSTPAPAGPVGGPSPHLARG